MVRSNTEAATEARTIEGPEDVEVGDTVDISGASFLPKSNLEVVEVDPEWATRDDRYEGDRVFTARIPNRSNARDYTFKVSSYGTVVTTNSRGYFDNHRLTAKKIVEADDDEADDDEADGSDRVVIRTDDGIIHATVDDVVECDRPEDGARLGGTLDADDPSVHYVDYWHGDDTDDEDDEPVVVTDGGRDVTAPTHECGECGARYYGEAVAEECEMSHVLGAFADHRIVTDGGRDYADAKDDEVDVVREALRDADDGDLDAVFGEVVDYAREAEATPARVEVVVVPAMVARKGLRDGFGRFRFDRADLAPMPGDGGERVVFHAHRDDDVRGIRNRVLQALTPTGGGTRVV